MEGVHDLSFHSTDGEKGTKREEETKKKKTTKLCRILMGSTKAK